MWVAPHPRAAPLPGPPPCRLRQSSPLSLEGASPTRLVGGGAAADRCPPPKASPAPESTASDRGSARRRGYCFRSAAPGRTPEGATLRSPSGRKYDGVVHCAVGVSWSSFRPLLSDAGRVIDITPNFSAILTYVLHRVTFSKKRLVPQLLLSLNKADLEFLVGLLEEDKLKTVIDSRFPLSDAGKAWQSSIDGHATGKIVVEMES
nr:chloroplast envelope quinone oxidoreductase homolog [Aegilops tauschii subsp. strangulata]